MGDCPECVGVLSDLLNSCPAESEACVSSQNDDASHFAAPWAYSGARADAMRRVVEVVTDPSGRGVDPVSYRGGKERDRLKVSTTVAAYDESSGYVYLQITTSGADVDSTQIFDVELLLWDDDEVVNVRCAARDRPKKGTWSLSYVDGVRFSRNEARDVAESIRARADGRFCRSSPRSTRGSTTPSGCGSRRRWISTGVRRVRHGRTALDERDDERIKS